MSQENVELAYRASDAFNRRDLGALLALTDDYVEVVSFCAAMEGDYHGHAGMRRWWPNLFHVFPDFNIEVVEVRDLGGDSMLAPCASRSRRGMLARRLTCRSGSRSGASREVRPVAAFGDENDALAAVALAE